MVYKKKFANFSADKSDFFASVKSLDDAIERAYDKEHNYGFVATNEKLIREEFNLLFNRLKEDDVDQDIFWFYCYYCCIMLQNYHRAYGQKSKADEFLKLRIQIKKRCLTGEFSKEPANNNSFLAYLAKAIITGLVDWTTTPSKVSKIRDKVSLANVYRIYWFFCRTTVTKSFLLARDLQLIDKLGSMLGKEIDVDNLIATLEGPNEVLRAFSVGFFVVRFIINAGMLIKHVLFPSQKEKELGWQKRFSIEIYKRHADLLNDLVWGTVNLVTNYNEFFHIAAPTASWIVAGFLFFDFCLIVWRHHLAKEEYLIKKAQMVSDQKYLQSILRVKPDIEGKGVEELKAILAEEAMHQEQCRLLTEQLKQLDISWEAKSTTYWFNASAALLLMTGFSASLIFTPPVMILACYVLCTFAIAMYLSDSAYNNYKEKSLLLEQAKLEDNADQVLATYIEARNSFILTMAKNVIMPALFITTFAVCWQAALVLTAVYIGYQLLDAYNKHTESKSTKDNLDNVSSGQELVSVLDNVSSERELVSVFDNVSSEQELVSVLHFSK